MKHTTWKLLKLLAILGLIVALMMSSVTAFAAGESISKKQAKSIALNYAGVKSASVKKWVRVALDGDEWDVDFNTKKFQFEVDINAATGEVTDFDKTEIKTKISKDKAKSAALSRAGLKSSAVKKWIKVKLDGDEWDVEFNTDSATYELEINAYSAEVVAFDSKEIAREPITEAKAKSAALKKAGIKSSAVKKWIKVLREGDEWELEFQSASYKYDVDVNVYSGMVTDYERKALPKDPISEATAKSTALKKAGVKESAVKQWTKVVLDGNSWELEFQTASYKFDVEINALTGKVKDYEKKALPKNYISEADAKAAALKRADVNSADVKKWIKVKRDGNEWEIEFQTASYRYDVEINAVTGKVKDYERKKLSTSTTASISLSKAKEIALTHAKREAVITGSVKYTKAKLDRDNGALIYEIEFRYNGLEFDYDIDANTGDILDWDMDMD